MAAACLVFSCGSRDLPPLPELSAEQVRSGGEDLAAAAEAARAAPEDAEAVGRFGMRLQAAKLYHPAAAAYRRAAALAPKDFRWAYYLGVALALGGKPRDAIPALQRAVALNPGYPRARIWLADQWTLAGEEARAREVLLEALARRPTDPAVLFRLGRIAMRERKPQEAAKYLEDALRQASFGAGHYALAKAYRALGKTEEARSQLSLYKKARGRQLPVRDPLLAAVNDLVRTTNRSIERAVRLFESGRTWDAIAELEAALRDAPDNVYLHSNLVLLYGQAGMFRKAEEHYRLARKINPDLPKLYYNWGLVLDRQGKPREARKAYQRALSLDRGFAYAALRLARVEARLGNRAAAARLYRRALRLNPSLKEARAELEELGAAGPAADRHASR